MELLQNQVQRLSQQQLQSAELLQMSTLELEAYLRELAQDLHDSRQVSRIFDTDWDQKYVQGMPVT